MTWDLSPCSLMAKTQDTDAHLSRLLPVSQGKLKPSDCRTLLEKYAYVTQLAHKAFKAFLKQKSKHFDPLVGENGCQIRAYMLLSLSRSRIFLNELQKKKVALEGTQEKVRGCVQDSLSFASFDNFLITNKLHIALKEWDWIVLTSYLLTVGKAVSFTVDASGMLKRQEKLNPDGLPIDGNVSQKFKKDLLTTSQVWLSELSVRFLQTEAMCEMSSHSKWFFGKHVQKDKNRRIATACYPTMRLIFTRLRVINTMITLRVAIYQKGEPTPYNVLYMTYKPRSKGGFKPWFMNHDKASAGTLFIDAKSITEQKTEPKVLEEKIKGHELFQLMLSNAADHPQYGTDDTLRADDPELEKARQFAREEGISRAHPFPFFLPQHIYWGGLEEYYKESEVTEDIHVSSETTHAQLYRMLYAQKNFPSGRLRLVYRGVSGIGETNIKLKEIDVHDEAPLMAYTAVHTPFQMILPRRKYRIIFKK